MKSQIPFQLLCRTAAAAIVFVCAAPGATPLDEALGRLDKASNGFRGLTAAIRMESYSAIIKETTVESGRIVIFRPKAKDLRMKVEIDKPEQRSVAYQNKKFQIFYPKMNTVQEYDLGKQSSLVDQFLLLGFGTTSNDLKQGYDVKHLGEETTNGVKADHLELTPKSDEVKKSIKRIEIWLSQADGNTIQQRIFKPSRDYNLISYSDMKVNPILTEESVKLKLPKGVKKETPQR